MIVFLVVIILTMMLMWISYFLGQKHLFMAICTIKSHNSSPIMALDWYNKRYFGFSVCYLPISKEEDEIRRERERVLKIFHEIEREIEQTCSSGE